MTIEAVVKVFSEATNTNDARRLAEGMQMFLAQGDEFITGNRWELLDTLCISTDTVLAEARQKGLVTEQSFSLMADLAQQTIAVFQFVAHARGDRNSGNFKAAQRQAKRLDAMTNSQLQLFVRTEKVQPGTSTPNITLSF